MINFSKDSSLEIFYRSASKKPGTWLSMTIRGGSSAITLQSTLLKWAQTNQPVRIIDSCLGALCNPTCPDKLTFVDAAVQWSDVLVGLVIFMSLTPTVLCLVLRISFKIQSFLVRRTQKQYEEQKSSEVMKILICFYEECPCKLNAK